MIRWIVGSSLKFRFLIVAGAGAMMLFGYGQLKSMPVDVFPEFAPPKVEVQTPSLGLSAPEVEALVTIPLEHALAGVPGLDVLRSKSVEQLSSIELLFKRGTDLLEARQLVAERVAASTPTLPTWSAPPVMLQPLSATSRTMKIGLSSKTLSTIDLSMIAYWKIRARLLRVPGVANVPIWGERIRLYTVEADPERMGKHGVSLQQVMETTADALDDGLLKFADSAPVPRGGFIDTPNQRLAISHIVPIVTPSLLSDLPITTRQGKNIRLSDVADLVESHPPLPGDAVINGGPGLMLIVEKLPWANTVDVTRGVEATLEELQRGLPGVEIDSSIFRPATFVESAIRNLGTSLILGIILMILVLGAFLFEWRTALISSVTIPISLVAAGLVLKATGATVNTMILAGFVIALGAVIDDAIVDIENIVRRLREARRQGSTRSAASIIFASSMEVRGAVVYASMIEALALLPVFFLQGLTGAFFRPLAFSYALAVFVSMSVALTTTPALSLILLRKAPLERQDSPIVRYLQRGYTAMLSRIVRTPRPAYAFVAIIMIAGLIAAPSLGQALLPEFKERDFLMHWLTKPGTSLPEEVRISEQAYKALSTIPGVRNFGSHIGQALIADEVVGVDFGENWISVDPKVDYDTTRKKIQEVVDGYPGVKRDVQTYLKERIREVLAGSHAAVTVRIFGQDLKTLREKAAEVEGILRSIPGTIEQHTESQADIPQIQVEVDLAAAQRYGVKPGDVRRAAATLIAGEEVGDLFFLGRTYDVNVWSAPRTRNSLTAIHNLPIDTPGGDQVRLGEVAKLALRPTPNIIKRENLARRIDVEANVEGRDLGSVVSDLKSKLAKVDFPLEFHYDLVGEFAEREKAQGRLFTWGMVAAIGIFMLLLVSFGSTRLAVLSFLTLPMAMVGGVLTVYFTGKVLSLGSLVGFFTVLGVVARNGIMMISHFQHLERYEGETFGPALVIRGARERLSPIMMTTLTTVLALVPLLVSGNIPGQEIEYPMALVILGGLVTSTLLNLFVVPSMYLRYGKKGPRLAGSGVAGI
jgi:CzcA family heavy metal efflux pump